MCAQVGGGSPEVETSLRLSKYGAELGGIHGYCIQQYARALDVIPYTLAENAGLSPINMVTELRRRHVQGDRTAGINVRSGTITDMLEEKVLQPLLVSTSALKLATECVRMLLKIDDIGQHATHERHTGAHAALRVSRMELTRSAAVVVVAAVFLSRCAINHRALRQQTAEREQGVFIRVLQIPFHKQAVLSLAVSHLITFALTAFAQPYRCSCAPPHIRIHRSLLPHSVSKKNGSAWANDLRHKPGSLVVGDVLGHDLPRFQVSVEAVGDALPLRGCNRAANCGGGWERVAVAAAASVGVAHFEALVRCVNERVSRECVVHLLRRLRDVLIQRGAVTARRVRHDGASGKERFEKGLRRRRSGEWKNSKWSEKRRASMLSVSDILAKTPGLPLRPVAEWAKLHSQLLPVVEDCRQCVRCHSIRRLVT